jgi:hypothetical protein
VSEVNEKTIRLAARIYECRDTSRRILGDRYESHMADLKAILVGLMRDHGGSIVDALKRFVEDGTSDQEKGVRTLHGTAAACELMEAGEI